MSYLEWKRPKVDPSEKDQFYTVAKNYWDKIPPTIDGMLGGFGHISSVDIQGSCKFMKSLLTTKKRPVGHHRALDCGAGIGRVSKYLLLHLFDYVDLVDQNQAYLEESKQYVGEAAGRIEKRVCSGLQSFEPENNHYDVIWCQWVLMQMKDDDVVNFFRRCQSGLTKNGLIILKENITSTGEIEIDETDSSVARSSKLFHDIIRRAGLAVVKEQRQQKFPKELYQVRMFACRSKDSV